MAYIIPKYDVRYRDSNGVDKSTIIAAVDIEDALSQADEWAPVCMREAAWSFREIPGYWIKAFVGAASLIVSPYQKRSKVFLNDRLRRVSVRTASRYIRRFGGKIQTESVTWAGSKEYHAVWHIDTLTTANGKLIAEIITANASIGKLNQTITQMQKHIDFLNSREYHDARREIWEN